MSGGSSQPFRPSPRRAALIVATVLLVTSAFSVAHAESEQEFPFKETGWGRGDVSDEPDSEADIHTAPGNGFPDQAQDFSPGEPTGPLLDAVYQYELFPFLDVAVNDLLQSATFGNVYGEDEKHMYTGFGTFEAWWGWWFDQGSGARAQSFFGGPPNGAIEDAHDDDTRWGDSEHYGNWDEFLWRGENPWIEDHPFSSDVPTEPSDVETYAGDEMLLFWHPGTKNQNARQAPIPTNEDSAYFLRNDFDHPEIPDMEYTDDTDQAPFAHRGNPQDGGWDLENRRTVGTLDAGMLITTRVTTSVNPQPLTNGRYDRYDATAFDEDIYTAVTPALEQVYRTAVWDPSGPNDHRGDYVGPGNDAGPKQAVHDQFTDVWLSADDAAVETADAITNPSSTFGGVAADAAGQEPLRHEPNTGADEYGANFGGASHDPSTSYGLLVDKTKYYEPGDGQTYDGYQSGEQAWLDAQANWGVPLYLFNFNMFGTFNLRPIDSPGDLVGESDQPGSPPGILGVSAHFGTWYDDKQDTWVGDVDENGRWSSSSDPYNSGLGDPLDAPGDPFYQSRGNDPNDYSDTQEKARQDPDKDVGSAEWRPLCEGGRVDATLEPTEDTDGDGGGDWGEVGVYVLHDAQDRGNPYDDVAYDAVGTEQDEDGRMSRLVTDGPIPMQLHCRDAETGLWFGDKWIVSPTGTADYPVKVETTGTVTANRISVLDGDGRDLSGQTVVDVDVLGSASD